MSSLSLPPKPTNTNSLSVKVTNISSLVTEELFRELFAFFGEIVSLTFTQGPTKECIVQFAEEGSTTTALHLSGTQFGDRVLLVSRPTPKTTAVPITPVPVFPQFTYPIIPSVHVLPSAPVAFHPAFGMAQGMHVINQPLPPTHPNYKNPVIPDHFWKIDPAKADQISRTIYIGNISSNITEPQLIELFETMGKINLVKLAGDVSNPSRFAFMEFAEVSSANRSLTLSGHMLGDKVLKVNHSKNAISKAHSPTDLMALQMEMDEPEKDKKKSSKYESDSDDDYRERKRRPRRYRSRSRDRSRERYRRRDPYDYYQDDYYYRDYDRRRSRSRERYLMSSREIYDGYAPGYRSHSKSPSEYAFKESGRSRRRDSERSERKRRAHSRERESSLIQNGNNYESKEGKRSEPIEVIDVDHNEGITVNKNGEKSIAGIAKRMKERENV